MRTKIISIVKYPWKTQWLAVSEHASVVTDKHERRSQMRVYGRSYFHKRFKMADLNININGLLEKSVLTASGTFGYGTEFQDFIDLERLGGFIVKER